MANPYSSQSISGYDTSPPADDGTQTSSNQLSWSKHKTKLSDPIKTLAEAIDTELQSAFATVDDASNLTTGTLPDARLSSNVPLKDAQNVFTAGTNAVVLRGAASGASSVAYVEFQDSGGNRKGLVGDASAGTQNISLTSDDGGITLTAPSGDITLNGVDVTDYARLSKNNTFTGEGAAFGTDAMLVLQDSLSAGWTLVDTGGGTNAKIWSFGTTDNGLRFGVRLDDNTFSENWVEVERTAAAIDTVNFPNGTLQYAGNEVLTVADEGSGNGLDADTVDAKHANAFLQWASGTQNGGQVTFSTSAASGTPSAGDIWVQHEA